MKNWYILGASALAGLLALGSFKVYERHWVTGSERKAFLRAIYSIDSMSTGDLSRSNYLQRQYRAQRLTGEAHIAAHTRRARILLYDLDLYMIQVDEARSQQESGEQMIAASAQEVEVLPEASKKLIEDGNKLLDESRQVSEVAAKTRLRLSDGVE